jgi:hypothetical protein
MGRESILIEEGCSELTLSTRAEEIQNEILSSEVAFEELALSVVVFGSVITPSESSAILSNKLVCSFHDCLNISADELVESRTMRIPLEDWVRILCMRDTFSLGLGRNMSVSALSVG